MSSLLSVSFMLVKILYFPTSKSLLTCHLKKKKNNHSKTFFKLIKISCIWEFFYVSRTKIQTFFIKYDKKKKKLILEVPNKETQCFFFNCPKIKRILSSGQIVIYYMCSTSFCFCSSEGSLLHLFTFSSSAKLWYLSQDFSLFRTVLISFACFFLDFFFVILIIVICHFYI